jgi:hypothetical protein
MNDMMKQNDTTVDVSTSSARLRKQAQEAIEFWKENCDGRPHPAALLIEVDAYSDEGHGLAHGYTSRKQFTKDITGTRRYNSAEPTAERGLDAAIAKAKASDPPGQVLYVAIEQMTAGFAIGAISGFVTLDPEAPNRPRNCFGTPGAVRTVRTLADLRETER